MDEAHTKKLKEQFEQANDEMKQKLIRLVVDSMELELKDFLVNNLRMLETATSGEVDVINILKTMSTVVLRCMTTTIVANSQHTDERSMLLEVIDALAEVSAPSTPKNCKALRKSILSGEETIH